MDYITRSNTPKTGFKPQYFSPQPKQGQQFDLPRYRPLASDQVQFGVINRAQIAKRNKIKQIHTQQDKQRNAIHEIEEGLTALYDQGLHSSDNKKFQAEVIKLLEAHPDLPMDISLRPDLANKKRPAIPLLHYMLGSHYFRVVDYILGRDKNIDFTRKDYEGDTALDVARSVAEGFEKSESASQREKNAGEQYFKMLKSKTEKYERLHPEKCPPKDPYADVQVSSSAIRLPGFSHKELVEINPLLDPEYAREMEEEAKQKEEAARRAEETAKEEEKARKLAAGVSIEALDDEPKAPKTKNQKAAEHREKLAQSEKNAREEKLRLQQEALDAKQQALHEVVQKQREEADKLEAAEKLARKAAMLNARLDAMPEMQVPQEWLQENMPDPDAGWQTVPPVVHRKDYKTPNEQGSATGKTANPTKTKENIARRTGSGASRQASRSQDDSHNKKQSRQMPIASSSSGVFTDSRPAKGKGAPIHKTSKPAPQPERIAPVKKASSFSPQNPESSHIPLWKLPLRGTTPQPVPKTTDDKCPTLVSTTTLDDTIGGQTPKTGPLLDTFQPDDVSHHGYFDSPTALAPVPDQPDFEVTSIEPFSLDAPETPVAKLPEFPKQPKLPQSEPAPLHASKGHKVAFPLPSRKKTRQSSISAYSGTQSFSSFRSNESTSSKISALMRDRDEKQRLLIQASAFNARNQAASFQEKQALMEQSIQALKQASKALAQKEHAERERDKARWDATNAQNHIWQMQQELNAFRYAYSMQWQGINTWQNDAPQVPYNSEYDMQQQAQNLEMQEAAIDRLEDIQGEIQKREAEIANNYVPCHKSGVEENETGYRVKDGDGTPGVWPGAWVPAPPHK